MIEIDAEESVVAAPIRLARVADFAIGAARVRPSVREVELGGRVERLEPRVMQALVALAEADGAVVTRDHLIARCWGGVVVGDDAVNRVMLKIRRLSELDANRSFTLETVARVGYRLRAHPALAAESLRVAALAREGLDAARRRWRPLAAVAGVLVAAASAAVAAGVKGRGKDYDIESITLVAQTRRMEIQPTLSPDGRFIVYVVSSGEGPSEQTDLYMRNLAGGDELRLTDTPDSEIAPVFSPTGDRLAYVRFPRSEKWGDPEEPCRIMVRVFPSGLERQVGACEGASWISRMAWTGDGGALIFNDIARDNVGRGPDELRMLDLETGRVEPLAPPPTSGIGDFNASVSPDGKWLAFVRHHGSLGAADAYALELATGRLVQVTRGEPVLHVAWAPDSRSVFVVNYSLQRTELSLHRIDGRGQPRRYVLGPSRILRPYGAHGLLAFELHSQTENLVRVGGSDVTAITSGNQIDYGADYSRDGVLAFFSAQSETWLCLQEPGQAPRRLVALTELSPKGLRWSPDGRNIVFAGAENGRSRLYIVDAESGLVRPVPIEGEEEPGNPSWSPDGESLVFTGASAAGLRLLRLSLTTPGAQPEPITDYGWIEGVETEEGLFARGLGRPGLWRIVEGEEPVLVFPELVALRDSAAVRVSMREWALSAGRIYAVDKRDRESARVIARPVDGGDLIEVGPAAPSFTGSLAVDPRTGEVVYAAVVDEQVDVGVIRLSES